MARLTATLKWREEFNVESTLTESFPPEIFGGLGYVYGRDKGGRPITYIRCPASAWILPSNELTNAFLDIIFTEQ
jgi:hypothetical protein